MELKDADFKKLIKQHKKFIEGTARKYSIGFLDDDELKVAAYFGFHKACTEFNPNNNTKAQITTFSFNFIKGEILTQEKEIRYSHFSRRDFEKYKEVKKFFEDSYRGYNESALDYDKISREIGIDKKVIQDLVYYVKRDIDIEKAYFESISNKNLSTAKIPISSFRDPSFEADKYFLKKTIQDEINKLNNNQKFILQHSYGTNDNIKLKKIEIAQKLNLSQSRINQLSDATIDKLRKNRHLKQLYLEQITETFIYGQDIDSYFINS